MSSENPKSTTEVTATPKISGTSSHEVPLEVLAGAYKITESNTATSDAEVGAHQAEVEELENQINKLDSKSNNDEKEQLVEFDEGIKETFEVLLQANIKLLNLLGRRDSEGLNNLAPDIDNYAVALAAIRDNLQLSDQLKVHLGTMAAAIDNFGISSERKFVEDLDSLIDLRETLNSVGHSFVAFGRGISDTYGPQAEPYMQSFVAVAVNLEKGVNQIKGRISAVRDYLDR